MFLQVGLCFICNMHKQDAHTHMGSILLCQFYARALMWQLVSITHQQTWQCVNKGYKDDYNQVNMDVKNAWLKIF